MRRTLAVIGLLLGLHSPAASASQEAETLVIVAGPAPLSDRSLTAVRAVPAPRLTAQDLTGILEVSAVPRDTEVGKLRQAFADAVDHFYAGRDKRADDGLAAFVAAVDEIPAAFFADPTLRTALFSALLHRAEVAFANRDEAAVEAFVAQAAARFPDLVPEARDFPPWLRQRHQIVVERQSESPHYVLLAEADCEVLVDGSLKGKGPRLAVALGPGRHAAAARCAGRLGPVRIFSVENTGAELELLGLRHADLSLAQDIVWLVTSAQTADALEDARRIARASARRRVAVVLPAEERIVWLEVQSGRQVRSVPLDQASKLNEDLEPHEVLAPRPKAVFKPWYKDGSAAAFVATGIAAFTTGAILSYVYGKPSEAEPFAWALIAAGVGAAGTGIALYVVPNPDSGSDASPLSAGVSLCASF